MERYPDIEEYGMIGDGHSAALISTSGCIDWLCMPRMDSPSVFARLLDWNQGGHFAISPSGDYQVERRYLPNTLVLETNFRTDAGEVRLLDCFSMRSGGKLEPTRQLIRIIEGVTGTVEMVVAIEPHLEYATVRPWIRNPAPGAWTAVGGRTGLLVSSDVELTVLDRHWMSGVAVVSEGDRRRFSVEWVAPEHLDEEPPHELPMTEIDRRFDETVQWWESWTGRASKQGFTDGTLRSGIVLKAMINPPTGAMVAAPTTSLPETVGGERNWDYRFCWIRDSVFAMRALTGLNMTEEANGFRRFVHRTTAGRAEDLSVLYGVSGETRLIEVELDHLEGYRSSKPVRVGNRAWKQVQLDVYGHVLDLTRRWVDRGKMPDDDDWRFICEMAELIIKVWSEPDQGIWEVRSEPRHFVHSKVMCWAGLDAAIEVGDRCGFPVSETWLSVCSEILHAVMERGVHPDDGHFVSSFGATTVDAALLLLPTVGFVEWDDPRMVATIDAIRRELEPVEGLLVRYVDEDGLEGVEGAFLACSFWLVEALARAGRLEEAQKVFDIVEGTSNDLGLFAEEYHLEDRRFLGNFPQALTHLAHMTAALAIAEVTNRKS